FSPSVTCGVWVGYDSRESLGEKETGARAALPIWIPFMRAAIAGKDDEQFIADQDDTLDRASTEPSGKTHPPLPIAHAPNRPQPLSFAVRPAMVSAPPGPAMKNAALRQPRAAGNTAARVSRP
ncbi:MAG: penicillin-binding protein, partial [Terracidiphilus sp.]